MASINAFKFAPAPDAFHIKRIEGDSIHGLCYINYRTFCKTCCNLAIDPTAKRGEIHAALQEPKAIADTPTPCPRRHRKWKRWVMFAALVAGLIWLNGPGLRWLGPKVAGHFFAKAGLRSSFALEGTFTGGLTIRNLTVETDKTLTRLTVGWMTPVYRISGLMKGRLDSLVIDGLHADLQLGLVNDLQNKSGKSPDLEELVKNLRSLRDKIIPLEADLKNISLNVTSGGKPLVSLAKSRIHHKAGDPKIDLEIGAITDAAGRVWAARESSIFWSRDDLTIKRLDPWPGLSVREFVLALPASGAPSAETELCVDDAVFIISTSPGFTSMQVQLREGKLRSESVAGHFALQLPATGELSSLSMNIEHLLPDPKTATGSAQMLFENIAHGEWAVPELNLDAVIEAGRTTIAARGVSLNSGFSLTAVVGLDRKGGGFNLGETHGDFNVAEVSKLIAALVPRAKAIDPAVPIPPSTIDGTFTLAFNNNRPASAEAVIKLKPAEPETVSPLVAKIRWLPDQALSTQIELDGMNASTEYDFENASYDGRMQLNDFHSARIDRWLDIVRASTHGAVSLTGNWQGNGSLKNATHHGKLTIVKSQIARQEAPPIHTQGEIQYEWPLSFTTKNLQLRTDEQTLAANLILADGFLEMSNLLWRDGESEMATGNAKLPVPDDVSQWRDTLAHDTRPVVISIQSKVLSLASLKEWLPEAERIDSRSTGQLKFSISGTYAQPTVDAMLEAKELRSPEQPSLPSADLKMTLVARNGHIALEGRATAKDFPPAEMTSSMPFRPAEWASKPGLIMLEKISARIDLPRIDLGRFTTLFPGVRKVSGLVSGNLQVAGEFGQPEIKGKIDLTEGGLELKATKIPAASGIAASFDLALDRITLRTLKATIAGGTLNGAGSLAIEDGKPGALDFRLKGDHLPLWRDESLIVRANSDLRLAGTWKQAAITGSLGVVDSIFYRDIELLPIGSPFTAPSAASLPKIDTPARPAESMPEPFRNWTLNVRARTENPILIRGNLATGEVKAKLNLGGTLGNPTPDGEARISNLRAALPFSTLTVRSGTVRFTPETGFDPILELRGTAEPRPYQVNVFVYGRASDPQVMLTSSPPLPENEIMTLLATGTTTTGLEDPQAAASRALQLFAEELRRGRFGVGKRLRPLLGLLDRVDFSVAEEDPYTSTSFSSATLQLADRWYLSAGMDAEGSSRLLAIWRLRFH